MLVLTPWKAKLIKAIASAESRVFIVSPYIKAAVARNVVAETDRKGVIVRTITRFKGSDFQCQVSDIDAAWMLSQYSYGREAQYILRVDNKLHAKIYLIDRRTVFIGSSNLTFSGLMSNYEACVQIDDPLVVNRVADELESYWSSIKQPNRDDFKSMRSELEGRGRRVGPDQEHRYTTDLPLHFSADVLPKAATDSWLDVYSREAPMQRVPAVAQPILLERIETSNPFDDLDGTYELVRKRVSDFKDALNGLSILQVGNLERYASVLKRSSFNSAVPAQAKLGINLPDDVKTFLSTPEKSDIVGFSIYKIAVFVCCLKAGVAQEFGVQGISTLVSATRKRMILSDAWQENFLGELLYGRSEPPSERNLETAGLKLFAYVAELEGLKSAINLIEEWFNPLDALGGQLGEILAFRDAKSRLQEIAQANGMAASYSDYQNVGTADKADWLCSVTLDGVQKFSGSGKTKSEAEEVAAQIAFEALIRNSSFKNAYDGLISRAFLKAKVDGLEIPPEAIDARISTLVKSAFLDILSVSLPPSIAFTTLLDATAQKTINAKANNRLLAVLGSYLFEYGVYRNMLRRGMQVSGFSIADVTWQKVIAAMKIPDLVAACKVPTSNQISSQKDCAQSVIAAVCLHLGWENGLDRFEQVFNLISESNVIRRSESKVTSVNLKDLVGGSFDGTVDYVSILQRYTQGQNRTLPTYSFLLSGPQHRPTVEATVAWNGLSSTASGASKSPSKQLASFNLLKKISLKVDSEQPEER